MLLNTEEFSLLGCVGVRMPAPFHISGVLLLQGSQFDHIYCNIREEKFELAVVLCASGNKPPNSVSSLVQCQSLNVRRK